MRFPNVISKGLMSVELIDHMGSDLSVVNAARVSFDKHATEFEEKDAKLIRYLAKHDHWSPFAHTSLQFRYDVPIFVARQEFKHIVGLVRNEMSRRYVSDEPDFFLPDEWRGAPVNMKQGSSDQIIREILWTKEKEFGEGAKGLMTTNDFVAAGYKDALFRYDTLLANGVAPEQARMVLPQGVFTSYYITGSLPAFTRFLKLRLDTHAQKEIQDLAKLVAPHVEALYPISYKELMNV